MKTAIEKEQLKIPIEIFLDVCKMIRLGNLSNKVTGCNETLGEVYLEIAHSRGNKIQASALKNIYESVLEWNESRYGTENPDDIDLS